MSLVSATPMLIVTDTDFAARNPPACRFASFGSGADGITVRVIAPHGAAAYQVMLRTGLAARETAGAALLPWAAGAAGCGGRLVWLAAR